MVTSTNRGSKRTLSFQNPKTGLTATQANAVFDHFYDHDVFSTKNSSGLEEHPETLLDVYYEETVITQLTDSTTAGS